MEKLGSLTLTGASRNAYAFDVYSKDADWVDDFACVYYVSQRFQKDDGRWSHYKIYIGETEDIKYRFSNHHKQDCFEEHDYNAISVHVESNEKTRLAIEQDLIDALDPPCNG